MWITPFLKGNTAYPHVDRLCAKYKKLFTFLLNFQQLIQFLQLLLELRICLEQL